MQRMRTLYQWKRPRRSICQYHNWPPLSTITIAIIGNLRIASMAGRPYIKIASTWRAVCSTRLVHASENGLIPSLNSCPRHMATSLCFGVYCLSWVRIFVNAYGVITDYLANAASPFYAATAESVNKKDYRDIYVLEWNVCQAPSKSWSLHTGISSLLRTC